MMTRAGITGSYLRALGLSRQAPSIAFLNEIASRHVATFSFASIGPRLGEDLPLDLASLHERIVVRKRGGYCFEQNGLLFDMLDELGFRTTMYLGRVLLNQDIHPGLTHRINVVDIGTDRYLVDGGFGPMGPRFPVSVARDAPVDDAHPYWVREGHPGEFLVQTLKDGAPWTLYRFELARFGQADCEVGHFYSHRHPKANFVNNLVACRKLAGEIRSLRNRDYWIIKPAGDERIAVQGAKHLRQILDEAFDLQVNDAEAQTLFSELP